MDTDQPIWTFSKIGDPSLASIIIIHDLLLQFYFWIITH